jgi:hypothetical protein
MLKRFVILAVTVAIAIAIALPGLAYAHAGHEHTDEAHEHPNMMNQPIEGQHGMPNPGGMQPQPFAGPNPMMLMQENIQLRAELGRNKSVSVATAVNETQKSGVRATYILVGLFFIAAGLLVRYLPGKEGK